MDNNTILNYLRVLLSQPPVAGVVVALFVTLFRAELRGILTRVAVIRFPGGELSTPQLEQTGEKITGSSDTPPQGALVQLPADLTLSPRQQQELTTFIQAERARAALWEYRFLNLFLVPHTQRALDWLAALKKPATLALYDDYWSPTIQNPTERNAIVTALTNHYLVQIDGPFLNVTDKGREYIQWRGPLSQAQTSPPAAITEKACD